MGLAADYFWASEGLRWIRAEWGGMEKGRAILATRPSRKAITTSQSRLRVVVADGSGVEAASSANSSLLSL